MYFMTYVFFGAVWSLNVRLQPSIASRLLILALTLCQDVLLPSTVDLPRCHLRHHVDCDTLYTLISELRLSWVDYCNSLFACSSQSTLHHLQRVQDSAVRLLWCICTVARIICPEVAPLAASAELNSVRAEYVSVWQCWGTSMQYLTQLIQHCDDVSSQACIATSPPVKPSCAWLTEPSWSLGHTCGMPCRWT